MSDYLSFLTSKDFTQEEKLSMIASNKRTIEEFQGDMLIIMATTMVLEIIKKMCIAGKKKGNNSLNNRVEGN